MTSSPEDLFCIWLWNAVTVLCDGTVTCGLDDPFKTRNYGSLANSTLKEILASRAIADRQQALTSGIPCRGCGLYQAASEHDAAIAELARPYPKRLIIEPSIKCNIRCDNETCNIANDKLIELRTTNFMPWDIFCRLLDEVGPYLDEIYFYNYGEPFIHPRALDMLAYAKTVNPRIKVTTSTNGILLARANKAERIVAEGLVNDITFTIGGVDQESYIKYHREGKFDTALLGMRRLLEEKRRHGVKFPIVHWRYLLFHWNDADDHLAEAQRLSEELGVDKFSYMLTETPMGGRSLRRAPGTPGFEAIKPWLDYQTGFSADPFGEAGLWGRQYFNRYGSFSWTGAQARVVAIPRRGRILLYLARDGSAVGALPNVRIRLPWGDVDGRVGRKKWALTEIVVPRDYPAGQVPIELEVEKLFVPMRHDRNSSDNRELGVMVSLDNDDIRPAPNPFRTAGSDQGASGDRARAGQASNRDRPVRSRFRPVPIVLRWFARATLGFESATAHFRSADR